MKHFRNEGVTKIIGKRVFKYVPKQAYPFLPIYDDNFPVQKLLNVDVTIAGDHIYEFEYVPGITLADKLNATRFFDTDLATIMIGVFRMLDRITRIVDGKIFILIEDNGPSNIVIGNQGKITHIDMLTAEWYEVDHTHYWHLFNEIYRKYGIKPVRFMIYCLSKDGLKNINYEWFLTWDPNLPIRNPSNFASESMRKYNK